MPSTFWGQNAFHQDLWLDLVEARFSFFGLILEVLQDSIHIKIFVNFVCFCSKILSAPCADDSLRCKCVWWK